MIGPDVYDIEDISVRPITKWFYDLELTKCKKPPEISDENIYYDFLVDGNRALDIMKKVRKRLSLLRIDVT